MNDQPTPRTNPAALATGGGMAMIALTALANAATVVQGLVWLAGLLHTP